MDINIDYLADHTYSIPELAAMHLGYFGQFNPDMTLESRIHQLHARLGVDSIPLTMIAIDQKRPIGSACLVHQDMDTHPELTPWVASVFVRPENQRQGVGTALMQRLEDEAYRLGLKKLYLYTPDKEAFYTTLGWQVLGREMYRGTEVTLMDKKIAS